MGEVVRRTLSILVPIYGISLKVWLGHAQEDFEAAALPHMATEWEIDGKVDGYSILCNKRAAIYVAQDPADQTPEFIGILCHECQHMGDQIMDFTGCDRGADKEHQVLLTEWLVAEILRRIKT